MGLFKRKNNNYQFSPYNQKVSNQKNSPIITSFDKINYVVVNDNSNEKLFDVCDRILSGHPVLVKVENLDINDANKMLSFLSGVIYATDGKIINIESRLFLMGRKEEFEDGSLYQYYEDLK